MNAPAIYFLHGAGMDHTVWVMQARYFARHGYRVMALDLPGHGKSDGPALDNVDAMADWLRGIIEATRCDAPSVTLVGHSMGTLICLSLAARYPDLADKLVLLGTSAPMPVADVLLNAAQDNDHAAIDIIDTRTKAVRFIARNSSGDSVSRLRAIM